MNILLIGSALLIPNCLLLVACALYARRSEHQAQQAFEAELACNRLVQKLNGERARVTVLEREVEALRRELRKLSGKFYAELQRREEEWTQEEAEQGFPGLEDGTVAEFQNRFPVCENWTLAKQQGPRSEAAQCQCSYCVAQRAERARLRGELIPRTVQGQAEVAKLNAGKP